MKDICRFNGKWFDVVNFHAVVVRFNKLYQVIQANFKSNNINPPICARVIFYYHFGIALAVIKGSYIKKTGNSV